jgi:hypothetical protein
MSTSELTRSQTPEAPNLWAFQPLHPKADPGFKTIQSILFCHATLNQSIFIGAFFDWLQSRFDGSLEPREGATTNVQLINVLTSACCISRAFAQYIAKIDMLSFFDFIPDYSKFKPRTIGSFSNSGFLTFGRSV